MLAVVIVCGVIFCGCSNSSDPVEQNTAKQSTDKYRNFYEIFVQSFNDSNGDGTGDIQGIIDKLDYLNDGDPNKGDDAEPVLPQVRR